MAHVERRLLDVLLQFVEVLGAGRAPGQDLRGTRLAEALEGAVSHALVGRQVGFLELVDAAAMGGPADDVEVEFQRVEYVHHVQHDVRRAQHVAAGIEQHVGGAPLGRRQDLLQRLRGKLHAGEQAHSLRHVAETAGGIAGADLARPRRLQRLHLGDGHPLADVDVLGTGLAAAGAAVAGAQPALQRLGRRRAARQRDKLADPRTRLAGVEADLARRRADLETAAAAGAAVGRGGGQSLQALGIVAHGSLPRTAQWAARPGDCQAALAAGAASVVVEFLRRRLQADSDAVAAAGRQEQRQFLLRGATRIAAGQAEVGREVLALHD